MGAGETVVVYYSTDAAEVTSSIDNAQITLTKADNRLTLKAADDIEAPVTATLDVRAGKIIKKIKVNIK